MTEDVKLTAIWLVAALLLSIIINSVALISRARSEPRDPRDYAASSRQDIQRIYVRPRHRRAPRVHRHRDVVPSLASLIHRQAEQIEQMRRELDDIRKRLRPEEAASVMPAPAPQNPIAVAPMPIPDVTAPTIAGYADHIARSSKLKDLTPKLAEKVAHILAVCDGARLISGYRRGARVIGSGRPSLHSHYPSKAADMAGNPSCIRRELAKWPGGLSTDYAAVRHYHMSYAPGGREWGSRFAHHGGRRHARKTRYAAAR